MAGLIIQSSATVHSNTVIFGTQVPNITAPLHRENVIIIHHQWWCVCPPHVQSSSLQCLWKYRLYTKNYQAPLCVSFQYLLLLPLSYIQIFCSAFCSQAYFLYSNLFSKTK